MNIFNLPDLGEGLPDAEIHEWFVQEGDKVTLDQPLVAMETAKAVVEVPCPQAGVIAKLFGKPGDIIQTGAALVGFEDDTAARKDEGTVVGALLENQETRADDFIIGGTTASQQRPKATPLVRQLAKKLAVDLSAISGTGAHGIISREDVEAQAAKQTVLPAGYVALRGVRRAMIQSMTESHQSIVPVSIYDEVDIHAWGPEEDITVRLIQALVAACKEEPALNAWFDTKHSACKYFDAVHLGLAIDTDDGLFVPVITDADKKSKAALRQAINDYKTAVSKRSVPPDQLKGASITLSNFGKFAGRYASPIIVPPQVAILGVGRMFETAVVNKGQVEAHRTIPLSLSFDHRAATGGDATRFLGVVMEFLGNSKS